jgi:glycosyltransferase involved in cell wall biosynthesis
MSPSLTVVMPVHNEAAYLCGTIDALAEAVARSGLATDVVVVDDGSSDGSAEAARTATESRLPVQVLTQPRGGRFKARRAGVAAAASDVVLLLDARVRLHPDSLKFLADVLSPELPVWNGHVVPITNGNPFGAFGDVLVHLAWSTYFDDPRRTSFGLDDFDRFPKGTGCFVAPRALLLEAMDAFAPRVSDWRFVSDDTQLIRWIAARHRIQLSPEFGCDYQPRSSLRSFLGNALYRGSTFLDGHGSPESRFFPLVVGFFPVSAGLVFLILRRPVAAPALAALTAGIAATVAMRARRSAFETLSFTALAPLYAAAHGAGMWRALAVVASDRVRRAVSP